MKRRARDIGIGVPVPDTVCDDKKCPFHGTVSVRGKIFEGVVVSVNPHRTIVVEREYLHYVPKYKRYERRRSKIHAHNPPCLNAGKGDRVKIAECRPLAKNVAFVAVQILERVEEVRK